ncbi:MULTISPECIES: hypothetical protein [Acinetobacter]|uniref:Uncharacterized protein n=1 Tax=Acinetobacter higginsii TaxID=70347 RepID=N9RI12_9GAMM|nr:MULTISPECIES: hypothetical protein [Acinetobacter]ENX57633.1 hypothetical protein F902_02030 [Acinetobacter higginsii]
MNELAELGCTCVQLNGKECAFEDRDYKFCPCCVEYFEGMAAVDESYIEYGGPEYEDEFAEEDEEQSQ